MSIHFFLSSKAWVFSFWMSLTAICTNQGLISIVIDWLLACVPAYVEVFYNYLFFHSIHVIICYLEFFIFQWRVKQWHRSFAHLMGRNQCLMLKEMRLLIKVPWTRIHYLFSLYVNVNSKDIHMGKYLKHWSGLIDVGGSNMTAWGRSWVSIERNPNKIFFCGFDSNVLLSLRRMESLLFYLFIFKIWWQVWGAWTEIWLHLWKFFKWLSR